MGRVRRELPELRRSPYVNPTTLAWWKWRLKVARPDAAPPVHFAEVELVDDMGVPDFVIELDHVRMRVSPDFDTSELRRLMATLC